VGAGRPPIGACFRVYIERTEKTQPGWTLLLLVASGTTPTPVSLLSTATAVSFRVCCCGPDVGTDVLLAWLQ